MMINIILPMVGNSSRFFNDGYSRPKYELELGGKSLFERVLDGLLASTDDQIKFHFGVRSDFLGRKFVEQIMEKYNNVYSILDFEKATSGQAATVFEILQKSKVRENIYIFNIDTILVNYDLSDFSDCAGGLDVFEAAGNHWSFAKLSDIGQVTETAEKKRISDHASTGMYYFNTFDTYYECYTSPESFLNCNEKFVAPMFNSLINKGGIVGARKIKSDQIILVGTPSEYQIARELF
jgi:hypothetical protein